MISVKEAFRLVEAHLPAPRTTIVPLAEVRGRQLAADVVADRDYPALDVSAMDGIAIASATTTRRFTIVGLAAAGAPRGRISSPNECMEIATGAAVPQGADTVVPVEELVVTNAIAELHPTVGIHAGSHVRRRGGDYRDGAVLIPAGTTVSGPIVAVLASVGLAEVPVVAPLRVTILATGSELVPVESTPQPHQIRSSNLQTLAAELAGWGMNVVRTASVADDAATLRRAVETAIAESDALVLSGGVSKGRFDLVRETVETIGATVHFHWVAQKPGRPMLFASLVPSADQPNDLQPGGCAIFGMPGNPQAATIGIRRYLVPATGRGAPLSVTLTGPLRRHPDRVVFEPVRVEVTAEGALVATPVASTGSGDFAGLARSDGFVQLAPGSKKPGDQIICDCYLWADVPIRRQS